MIVGVLLVSLRLDGCRSLKDKRRVIRSLLERIRREFSACAAEVADQELWGNATIGLSCVTNDAIHAESILQHIVDLIDARADVSIDGMHRDLLRY